MNYVPLAGLLGGAVGAGSAAVAMGLLLAGLLAVGATVLVIGASRRRPARRTPPVARLRATSENRAAA